MMSHLENLAARMLRDREFLYLKTVADLMVGLNGPEWGRLPDKDKAVYLEQMKIDFHAKTMGDSQYCEDPDYRAVWNLIEEEYRAVWARLLADRSTTQS